MSVLIQIILGSALLTFCLVQHIGVQVFLVRRFRTIQETLETASSRTIFLACSVVVLVLLLSHTTHLYLWAIALWVLGALPGYEQPIYFALVTYSTVGYGDVTLAQEFRVFGAMAAVTGILAFGLTTAFLVAFFPRIIVELRDDRDLPPQ